jgi:RHS repeat-associated protein
MKNLKNLRSKEKQRGQIYFRRYNRHRYYNPGTGRYLTPDPIKLAGGLNNYQYVPNPTGWVDPIGLSCLEDKKMVLVKRQMTQVVPR